MKIQLAHKHYEQCVTEPHSRENESSRRKTDVNRKRQKTENTTIGGSAFCRTIRVFTTRDTTTVVSACIVSPLPLFNPPIINSREASAERARGSYENTAFLQFTTYIRIRKGKAYCTML